MANNPVFDRIDRESAVGYAGFRGERVGAYTQPTSSTTDRLEAVYAEPAASPVQTGRVSLDDVIMKCAALFGILVVVGAGAWQLTTYNPALGSVLMLGGIVVTLVLGFVISLGKTIRVPLILAYAALEGIVLGALSKIYETAYDGIVPQAILATLAVFAAMLLAYRTGLVKVTAKFRKVITFAVMGYALFALVNFLYAWIGNNQFGFGGSGPLGIGISIFATGLAALMLTLDFDSIDRAIAAGAPEKYSWLLAFGLLVTLVWLYIEVLRLLARLREGDG